MVTIVAGAAFVLLAIWYVVDVVRVRGQDVGTAVARVERELARSGGGQACAVTVWSAHPLNDHMVKRLAEREGYRFVSEARSYNGARTLTFDPPKQTRKLSLDV